MNADTIADLKEFMTTLIAQQHASLREDLGNEFRKELHAVEHRLEQKIDDLSASVAAAMEVNSEDVDSRLNNHEHRLTVLEQKAA